MKLINSLLFFLMMSTVTFGQKISKGDYYFYEYAYKDAIREYNKEQGKRKLSQQQYLNLADAYLKIGNFERASTLYISSYERDSTLANTYLNKLLLSVAKSDSPERLQSYVTEFKSFFSKELIENAAFNFEILAKSSNKSLDFYIFNCNLNSAQSDFSPAFYKDEVLFTSGRNSRSKSKKKIYEPTGEAYLDIYSGKIQPDGDLTVPRSFAKIPSSNYHKATPFYVEELDLLVYMLSNAEAGDLLFDKNMKNTLAIGSVTKNGNFQYLLRDLSTSFYYPFYEASTEKLYFAADFEGGYGGTDIYYVFTNKGQIMSAPVNLGPRINSPGNEVAPYIFEGNLYFSSDIFFGLGDMDIYTAKIQEDDTYSIPVNLGPGINSSGHDFGFIIKRKTAGFLGYFSSNREGGKGQDDIYGFKVGDKPGLKTLVVKGLVENPNANRGIKNTTVQLLDEEGNFLKETFTNEEGEFQFEIPFRSAYGIKAMKTGYGSFSSSFSLISEEEQQLLNIELPFIEDIVEEKENQTVLKLKKLKFNGRSSTITDAIALELNKVVNIAQSFPMIKLSIASHTNSRGSSASNYALSEARSKAIKSYLLSKGLPESTIVTAVGYGETKLTNQCKDGVFCLEFLHEQNVRSYLTVLNYEELKN
tara:strand:- start:10213 stop:12144 length:1932 start_codon:yes stop_codon:yes gene_type:complete